MLSSDLSNVPDSKVLLLRKREIWKSTVLSSGNPPRLFGTVGQVIVAGEPKYAEIIFG